MRIQVPFKNLKAVAHLADIHVRLFRRHEEYEQAFDRLYQDIRDKQLKDFVIVLAGDIVHAKTDMSPEMIEVTSRFLKNIAEIAPTILIAGNHDCNLANTNRLDALTPIVNNLQHQNLYYIKESNVVYVADTAFTVCSIFDEQHHWPTADEIDPETTNKIALYHGPVHGAVTDTNFTITNRHVNINTFNGYDIVMLGDIHKPNQILKEKDPIIVYPGSLLQQTHAESFGDHGWCLWDIPSRTFDFVPLENDYGYVTLEVHNKQITYPSNLPKNIRARLFTGELDTTEIKKLVTNLRSKYNIVELSVNKTKLNKLTKNIINQHHDLLDLTNVSLQQSLITNWLSRKHPLLNLTVLNAIEKINKDLNGKIIMDDHSRGIHWRPLKFTFSNMFSYGENNEINFTDMKGVYGIFAANAAGKSSIMDALMFCLYDKTPRAYKADHIINNRKDKFECELLFEINNETFGIKRIGTRKKTGEVKVDASFWKVLDNGSILNLNGEDRRYTNINIRSYVGTYEDFVMTALSSQHSNALFIDRTHTERKDLLIQFMGLNIFDKLYDAAHDESKEIAGILKQFKKSDVTDKIVEIQHKLTTETTSMARLQHEYDSSYEVHRELDAQVMYLQGKKKPVPETTGNLDNLLKELENQKKKLKKLEEDYAHGELKFKTETSDLKMAENDFEQYDLVKLEKSVKDWNRLNELLIKGNGTIRVLNTKIEEKIKFKNKLLGYKYNPECEVCVTNNTSVIEDLRTVNAELDELNAKRLIQEDSITCIIQEMKPLEDDKTDYEEARKAQEIIKSWKQKLAGMEATLTLTKMTHEKTQLTIDNLKNDVNTYKTNEENILFNQKIDIELESIQKKIGEIKKVLQILEVKLRDVHSIISVLQSKKDELVSKLKEAEELETIYEAYNHYMLAVGRDGVPYELISKTIPSMETEINNILSQIVDFTVSLNVDGKNINGKLTYDNDRIWPLENSSGMERFISSLAIRVALLNVSNLPKSNMLIIDEGFGVLDSEHLHSMQTLFSLLKMYFDFILIISHLDTARDMVDSLIEIKKDEGYSYISV